MKFEILDESGAVINTILASLDFMEANFPPLPIIPEIIVAYDDQGNAIEPEPIINPVYETYAQYRELIEIEPVIVPSVVSMAQARKALVLAGVSMATVQAALEAITDATARELAIIDWEYAATVRHDSPLVQSIGAALGLDVDALFIGAAQL